MDEDEEDDEDEDAKKRRKRKRRREQREEEEQLDEEDLDLIGEANPEWERKKTEVSQMSSPQPPLHALMRRPSRRKKSHSSGSSAAIEMKMLHPSLVALPPRFSQTTKKRRPTTEATAARPIGGQTTNLMISSRMTIPRTTRSEFAGRPMKRSRAPEIRV